MDKYVKQIQTRMNRQLKSRGLSVTKQQVRDVYSEVVENPDKPTDLEMSRVIEVLAKQLSSSKETLEEAIQDGQLAVSQDTEIQESQSLEVSGDENIDPWVTDELEDSLTEPLQSNEVQSEESGELAITEDSNLPTHTPEETAIGGITQAEIEEAVELAIAQTGEAQSEEAREIMTELALYLSSDINTLEQAVAVLVSGYLNKRSNLLKSAMGALNTLRNAQTNSFCGGLTPEFLAKQNAAKKELMEIGNIFN